MQLKQREIKIRDWMFWFMLFPVESVDNVDKIYEKSYFMFTCLFII